MSKLDEIMDIFIAAGKSETPVAIIDHATTDKEKFAIGKVKDIIYKAEYEELSNPAVIVIGDVVNLHPTMISQHIRINSLQGNR